MSNQPAMMCLFVVATAVDDDVSYPERYMCVFVLICMWPEFVPVAEAHPTYLFIIETKNWLFIRSYSIFGKNAGKLSQ